MSPLHRIPRHPVALALFAYRTWYRLPPTQRRQVLEAAKTHGPKVAAVAAATARRTVERTRNSTPGPRGRG